MGHVKAFGDGHCWAQAHFLTRKYLQEIQKAMISYAHSGIVRPVVCTSRNSKNAPVSRTPRTTRRSALRLSVAMAAGPLIEIYVKGEVPSSACAHTQYLVSFGIALAT